MPKLCPRKSQKLIDGIPNKIGIRCQYVGATDYEGASVRVSLPREGSVERHFDDEHPLLEVTIPFDDQWSFSYEVAIAWIYEELGLLPIAKTQSNIESGGNDLLIYDWWDRPLDSPTEPENAYTKIKELLKREEGA